MHEHASVGQSAWGLVDWLCYFLWGNGLWMNGWHCAGQDIWALGFRSICCLFMSYHYYVYARQWKTNFRCEPDSPGKTHALWLRYVFLWCLSIHIIATVVSIFIPLHYLIGIMFLVNGLQTRALWRSNLQRLAHERWRSGERALENEGWTLDEIRDTSEHRELHAATCQAAQTTANELSEARKVLKAVVERLAETKERA